MITTKKISWWLVALCASSCNPTLVDDPIPYIAFNNIIINLNLPDYAALRTPGGYKAIGDGGIRGIIIYHDASNIFHAFERNCSYHPNEACATVDIHASGLYMWDPCCGSTFDFSDGSPTGGPAWRPLQQYQVQLDGVLLTITDDVLN